MTGSMQQRYLDAIKRAERDGVVVKWNKKAGVFYVGKKGARSGNSRVDYAVGIAFSCECSEYVQTGYCVHCAVARKFVLDNQAKTPERSKPAETEHDDEYYYIHE